jgi:hypothetical protein
LEKVEEMNGDSLCKLLAAVLLRKSTRLEIKNLYDKIAEWVYFNASNLILACKRR